MRSALLFSGVLLVACGDETFATDPGVTDAGGTMDVQDSAAPTDGQPAMDGSPADAGCESLPDHKLCGGVCVDLSSDSNNCGTCGKLCAPGTVCGAGDCLAPMAYYSCLTHDAATHAIVWTNGQFTSTGDGAVYRMPEGGGKVTLIADKQDGAHAIATDGTYAFWTVSSDTTNPQGAIMRAKLDGTGLTSLAVGTVHYPNAVAVDGANLVWAQSDGSIWVADKDGMTPTKLASTTGVSSFRAAGGYAYWAPYTGGTLSRIKEDVSGGSTVVQGLLSPRAFAVDDGSNMLYIGASAILAATTTGTNQTAMQIYATTMPIDVASAGTSVYWISQNMMGMSFTGDVLKGATSGGGTPQKIASIMSNPGCLTLDATRVYWTANGLAIPGSAAR